MSQLRVHYVLYERPLAGATACDRSVSNAMQITTNLADVTCVTCRRVAGTWPTRVPRRLPPTENGGWPEVAYGLVE